VTLRYRLRQLTSSSIFANAALVGFAQVVIVIIGFAATAILARILDPKDFGSYQLFLAWLSIGAILSLPGFSLSILKSGLKGANYYFWTALRYSVTASVLGAIAISAVALALSEFHVITQYTGTVIVLVSIGVATTGFYHYDSGLLGRRDYKSSRLLALLGAIGNLISVSIVAVLTKSPEWTFVSYLLSRLLVSLVGIAVLKKNTVTVAPNPSFENELTEQGIRQTALNVFSVIASQADKIILGVLDPVVLAIYSVGVLIPGKLIQNSKSIMGVITAEWGAAPVEVNDAKLMEYGPHLFLTGTIACACTILALPALIPLAFGPAYSSATEVGQWFSLILIGNFWFTMYCAKNQLQSDGRVVRRLQIGRQLLFLGLLAATVNSHGIAGVVFSQITSHFTIYFAAFVMSKSEGPYEQAL
jgi:O-antigen/teichoic acid export membrane protein